MMAVAGAEAAKLTSQTVVTLSPFCAAPLSHSSAYVVVHGNNVHTGLSDRSVVLFCLHQPC